MFPIPTVAGSNRPVEPKVKKDQEQEKSNTPWTQSSKLLI